MGWDRRRSVASIKSPSARHVHVRLPVYRSGYNDRIEARDLRDSVNDEAALRPDAERVHTKSVVGRPHDSPELRKI